MKKTRIFTTLTVSLAAIACLIPVTAWADGSTISSDDPSFTSSALSDNYWAPTLEETGQDQYPVYPRGLRTPAQTQLSSEGLTSSQKIPTTGIYSRHTLYDMFGGDITGEYQQSLDSLFLNQKLVNTLGINKETDTIKNVSDFNIYGDLSIDGNTESSQVPAYSAGDTKNIHFSMDTTLIKQVLSTFLLTSASSDNGDSETGWNSTGNSWWENSSTQSDPELVYTLDLPQGMKYTDKSSVSISGLEGFTATASSSGNTLTVTVKKSSINTSSLKEWYAKVKNTASQAVLSVNNVLITDDAPVNTDLTITGKLGGEYDFIAKQTPEDPDTTHHNFWYMAAKQSDSGRDAKADASKPNLITYTFRVNPRVTFMDGQSVIAKVSAESGKTINNDSLTDQSMPANPTHDGYTFKGWNTAEDGSGTWFTGDTQVIGNITVYAVYDKAAAPTPAVTPAPSAQPKAKTIAKTGTSTSTAFFAMLCTTFAGALMLIRARKYTKK